MNFEVIWHNE